MFLKYENHLNFYFFMGTQLTLKKYYQVTQANKQTHFLLKILRR
jgi:hypothetical protein